MLEDRDTQFVNMINALKRQNVQVEEIYNKEKLKLNKDASTKLFEYGEP